jgi:hypothetical protein
MGGDPMALQHGWLLEAAAAGLAGYVTVDDLRARPPAWTATYDVPWETMANCLRSGLIGGAFVTPQYDQRNRTAVLTLAMQGILAPGPIVGEFQIQQIGQEDRSEVQFRPRPSMSDSDTHGHELADRCARGLARISQTGQLEGAEELHS